jgi:uncharacterized protein
MRSISGLRIVVTGASSGIGAALVRQLAEQGARLVIAARRRELLERLAAELKPAECHVAVCDVTQRANIFALAAEARRLLGEADVWVSNAGGGLRQWTLDATEQQMQSLFRLNCLSALFAYQALIPQWINAKHAGQIVDICSLGGRAGYAYNAAYSASKHGMSAIGDAMRQELLLKGSGITVTTVYPGPTKTDLGKNAEDLTGGAARAQLEQLQSSRSMLARRLRAYQSADAVAAAIVRAIRRRSIVAWPHKWGALAVWLNALLPTLTMQLYARANRSPRSGETGS